MDFSFDEEQEAVRELARQIFSDHGAHEHLRQIESSKDGIDHALWQALGRANLLGVGLPEAWGGSDLGLTGLAILLEEQGRCVAQVPVLASAVLGGLTLAAYGSEAQQQRWLPELANGEAILSAALEEPASADPGRPRTTAVRDGDGWRLDGEKIAVPVAHLAARILVPARDEAGAVHVFAVDPAAEGVSLTRQDPTNHEPWSSMRLRGTRVDVGDRVGGPDVGAAVVAFMVSRGRVGVAATLLGVAEEALHRTAEYTTTRKQFEKPIGAFQGVSLRAADAYIDVECMRSTLWQALFRIDQGQPADLEVAVAKWWSSHGGHRVVHTAQHLHGGTGADIDYPIHRYLLWFKQLDLTLGGGTPQLARIGALVARGADVAS